LSTAIGARGAAASDDSDPWARVDLSGSLAEASRRILAEVERRKLSLALEAAQGDRQRAAAALQVPLRYLLGKMKEHRMD
jgi:DNA-binding NtrC family response regulator